MDKKQDAISRAKQAALSSVSFGMKATPIETDKLKRVSYVAAKEAVLFRKNIELLVVRFRTLDSIVLDIKKVLASKATPNKKLARITSIIVADGNKYKEAEAILEEKADISSLTDKVTAGAIKATLGAAAFALALPLLLSPQVREYVKSFFKGFLDGLGLSEKNLLKLKVALVATAAVLGTVFTIKALNTVLVAFNRMKKLAQLVGILATATSESGHLELERGKKAKKLKQAKRLKRLITAASSLLKASVAAYAVGTAIDAIGGTLIDIATSDEDIDAENLLAITLNNVIESATLGQVKTDVRKHADKMDYDAAFPLGDSSNASTPPAAVSDKNWNTDPNVIEVDTGNKEEVISPPVTVTAPRENAVPLKKPSPTINEAFPLNENNKKNDFMLKNSFSSLQPSLATASASDGQIINNMSNKVNIAEEMILNNNNIILVNNSTNVYQQIKQNRKHPSNVYSATVGA